MTLALLPLLVAAQLATETSVAAPVDVDTPRVHASLGFALAGGVGPHAWGAGPGVSAELGAQLSDRLALVVRLTVGTIVVVSAAHVGLGVDLTLSERFNFGFGIAAGLTGFGPDQPADLGVQVPLRLSFAPTARAPGALRRGGLVLFAELSPGLTLVGGGGLRYGPAPSPALGPLSVQGALGIGYGWW